MNSLKTLACRSRRAEMDARDVTKIRYRPTIYGNRDTFARVIDDARLLAAGIVRDAARTVCIRLVHNSATYTRSIDNPPGRRTGGDGEFESRPRLSPSAGKGIIVISISSSGRSIGVPRPIAPSVPPSTSLRASLINDPCDRTANRTW